MEFADVIFPQDVGPLTYQVPPALRESTYPGVLVDAVLRKSLKRGVVLACGVEPPPGGWRWGRLQEDYAPRYGGEAPRPLDAHPNRIKLGSGVVSGGSWSPPAKRV